MHGDANAQATLAVAYEEGILVQKNLTEAVKWYRKAGRVRQHRGAASSRESYTKKARAFLRATSRQFQWYGKAAALGYAPAQCNLGNLYRQGLGVSRDLEQAAKWYEVAARQGDAQSQSNLGYMYDHGQGVVQDYKQAVFWYRKAAEQGYSMAQRNLGVMYVLGKGVPTDESEGMKWFEKAAAQGLTTALINEAILYMEGTQTPRDYAQASGLLQQALEAGEGGAKPLLEKCRRHLGKPAANEMDAASSPSPFVSDDPDPQ